MKKPIIFAGVAAVLLLVVGYFVLLPMLKGDPHVDAADYDEDEPVAATAKKPKRKSAEPGLMFPVAERVLNLTSRDGIAHYARIELAFEFEPPAGAKTQKSSSSSGGHGAPASTEPALDPLLDPVVARKALIDDMLVRIVGGRTMEEMTTNEGRDALKQEILAALEEMVVSPTPVNVYIVRLIVQ